MIDPVYIDLGENIRKRRERVGMTQGALGQHLGLSRTSITNIERGRQAIQLHQLYRAAEVLGASLIELLPSAKQKPQMNEADDLPEEFKELLTKLEVLVDGPTK